MAQLTRKGVVVVVFYRPRRITRLLAQQAISLFGVLIPDGENISFQEFGTLIYNYYALRKSVSSEVPGIKPPHVQAYPIAMALTKGKRPHDMPAPAFLDADYLDRVRFQIIHQVAVPDIAAKFETYVPQKVAEA